ncbi:MAG TPA: hypothetical protein VIM53_05115 [Candidatus Saccharimonadales bacterium]
MLQLSNMLINRPVLSLRTGTEVATAVSPIINPNNLKIEGFYCQDSFNRKHTLVLVEQDIRDILPQGIVINDFDVLVSPEELVRLRDIMDIDFTLIGKPVVTADKTRMGKVGDFATDVDSMFIQKLYVTRSMIKSLTSGELGVDRSQIIEITRKQIVISNPLKGVPMRANAVA